MKKICLCILILNLIVVMGGCTSIDLHGGADAGVKSELMQYVMKKYGGEYDEIFYETAADATQSYVLCLKDKGGYIFNVYEHAGTGKITDDYKDSVVDDKLHDYLLEYLFEEIEQEL